MTLEEARKIGESRLQIDRRLFDRCLHSARILVDQEKGPQTDIPVMTLALAILGVSKAHKSDEGLNAELTDALSLVAKAEKDWLLEQKAKHHGRII